MTAFWKNKKIFAYIALAHHARFIAPVMEVLASKGAITKYVVGQAERSQEITAIKSGLDHIHIFDYIDKKDNDQISANYLSSRDAFTAALKNNFIFSTTPVTVIDKTLYAAAVEYIGFKNLLVKEKPDLCFALHELHRWGKIFSFWAKKFNVPFITFQEGLYSGLDFGYTGHVQYSTLNLVWGNQIKKKLAGFEAPEDKIIPVGNTHLSNEIDYQRKNEIRAKKRKWYQCEDYFTVLLLFSGELPKIETLLPVFESVCSSNDKYLLVKFHPITTAGQRSQWAAEVPETFQSRIQIILEDENTYDLISLSDLCVIVQPSTTGLEALAFGKPLVQLDIKMRQKLPYSFETFNVAAKMTPSEFGKALSKPAELCQMIKKEDVSDYLKNELHQVDGVADRVVDISKKLIQASRFEAPEPIRTAPSPSMDWSIIFPIAPDPDLLLLQLETMAVKSEGRGTFEVILVEPDQLPEKSVQILESLKGDVVHLKSSATATFPSMLNKAACISKGKRLVFMDRHLIPGQNWLKTLDTKAKNYGDKVILGSRIIDQKNSILHAGIALDHNNTPVPLYQHLSADFHAALKEQPVKMVDHFISIDRDLFFKSGGFWEKAGKFTFMDLCLRVDRYDNKKNCCIYLPEVCMTEIGHPKKPFDPDCAIHFFGRWHNVLWNDLEELYLQNNLTKEQLDAERLRQSMTASDMIE